MPKYDIKVFLSGHDGNVYVIIGSVVKALQREGVEKDEIDKFKKEATSGDYDNLIQTCIRWVDVC